MTQSGSGVPSAQPHLDGYRDEFADEFTGDALDLTRWLPAHLPQWSSRSQAPARLYTPVYGYFEVRAKALADAATMVALWMIGCEDAPERSGEICICEIFGSDVAADTVRVGMGIHPFGDPQLTDDFSQVPLVIDATDFHVYDAEWTPTHAFRRRTRPLRRPPHGRS